MPDDKNTGEWPSQVVAVWDKGDLTREADGGQYQASSLCARLYEAADRIGTKKKEER